MSRLKLKHWQRRRLRQQLKAASDARTYRRTLAVLELDCGRSAAAIAAMLGVTRQSVHHWAAAFAREPDPAVLSDEDRGGRPPLLAEQTERLLPALMGRSPQDLGYPHTDGTVPLLRQELERGSGLPLSDETVRRGLRRLGFVWKRPRYLLDPDPEREKKKADSSTNPRPAAPEWGAGGGRDGPADVPAVASRLVPEGHAGGGPPPRVECPTGDLRSHEPGDRNPAVAGPAPGAGR